MEAASEAPSTPRPAVPQWGPVLTEAPPSAGALPSASTPVAAKDKIFGPCSSWLRTRSGQLLGSVINVDCKRIKIAVGSQHKNQRLQPSDDSGIDCCLRVPLNRLVRVRYDPPAGSAGSKSEADASLEIFYRDDNATETCVAVCLREAEATMLHRVLSPFDPKAGRAMRAALQAGGWENHLGRAHCFSHGDAIPSLISSRGQNFHETDGELRYVLVEKLSRYGYDLQLKMEARTLGVWGQALTFSLNAAEFSLVPYPNSQTGDALCLQRVVEGASGLVAVEDVLSVSMDGIYLRQERRYCSGAHCIAKILRFFRFTEDKSAAHISHPPLGQVVQHSNKDKVSYPVQAQITSHHQVAGHTYYTFSVGWATSCSSTHDDAQAEERVVRRTVSKRYSEFVALNRELHSRQGDPILVVGSSDTLVPKFRDRAAAGRGIEEVAAERWSQIEEWLQMALLHPLVSSCMQLQRFLATDVVGIDGDNSCDKPHIGEDCETQLQHEPARREVSVEALGKHIEDGHTHYVYRIMPCVDLGSWGDDKDELGIVISKRYSAVLELAESAELKELCRDPDTAADLGHFRKCNVDSGQRPSAISEWLSAAGNLYSVCCSVTWRKFIEADSMRLLDTPAAARRRLCLRLSNVSEDERDGHALYTVEIFPASNSHEYSVTRPAEVNCGQLVQFRHADNLHHVVVPASTAVGQTFAAVAPDDPDSCWLITKRYSQWVALDSTLRRQPSLAQDLPARLGNEKSIFSSKREDTERRAGALASYVSALAHTPSVWFSTALHGFVAKPAQHTVTDVSVASATAHLTALSSMQELWHQPMSWIPQRAIEIDTQPSSSSCSAANAALLSTECSTSVSYAAQLFRVGPSAGWGSLVLRPTKIMLDSMAPSMKLAKRVCSKMPPWMMATGILRRIRMEDSISEDDCQQLHLLIETQSDDNLDESWIVAHKLSFAKGEFWIRARGGGRGEVLTLQGCIASTSQYFELEICEHPLGMHEHCRWGAPDDANGAEVSWIRNYIAEVIAPVYPLATACGVSKCVLRSGRELLMSTWSSLLRRRREFVEGDDIPEAIARTSGAKTFAVATALGLSVPLPGFVVVGAIAGGIAATPTMQVKATRWMANEHMQRTTMTEATYGDVVVAHELCIMGKWINIDEYSFNNGDIWIEQQQIDAEVIEVLCLRSRLKRENAVYIVIEELHFEGEEISDAQSDPKENLSDHNPAAFASGSFTKQQKDPTDPRSKILLEMHPELEHTVREKTMIGFSVAPEPETAWDQSEESSQRMWNSSLAQAESLDCNSVESQPVIVVDEEPKQGLRLVERRRMLCGTTTICETRRTYKLLKNIVEDQPSHATSAVESTVVRNLDFSQSMTEALDVNGTLASNIVQKGWLEMKVKLGWTKRWFELSIAEYPSPAPVLPPVVSVFPSNDIGSVEAADEQIGTSSSEMTNISLQDEFSVPLPTRDENPHDSGDDDVIEMGFHDAISGSLCRQREPGEKFVKDRKEISLSKIVRVVCTL